MEMLNANERHNEKFSLFETGEQYNNGLNRSTIVNNSLFL